MTPATQHHLALPARKKRRRGKSHAIAKLRPREVAERRTRRYGAEITRASTSASGSWSAATLAQWGVAWPPKAGRRAQVIDNAKRNGRS